MLYNKELCLARRLILETNFAWLDEVSSCVVEAYVVRNSGQPSANSQEEAGILGLKASKK